jgi:hypothetical protein
METYVRLFCSLRFEPTGHTFKTAVIHLAPQKEQK